MPGSQRIFSTVQHGLRPKGGFLGRKIQANPQETSDSFALREKAKEKVKMVKKVKSNLTFLLKVNLLIRAL